MKKNTRKSGAAILIVVLFFVILSITLLIGVSMPIAQQIENATEFLASKKGYTVADAQAENALYRFNNGKTDAPSTLSILGAEASGVVTDINGEKQVSIEGIAGSFQRFIKARFREEAGISFSYGLQIGSGGLTMSGSSYVVGNVYSNGNITASGSCSITGSAVAAVTTDQTTNQQNLGVEPATTFITFGNANTTQDFAQSFVVSTSTIIAEASFYLRKVGAPSNATVKIVTDNTLRPNRPSNVILASGVLSAASVGTSFGWVDVSFTTNPSLIPGNRYWLIIDIPANSTTKYYQTAVTTVAGAYADGQISFGMHTTDASQANWYGTSYTTKDSYFKVHVGGVSYINGVSIGGSGGDARAYSVANTTASGVIYCQIGTSNNKACNTSQATPSPLAFPVSNSNITQWKDEATALGVRNDSWTINGSTATSTSGMKIVGDLTVTASGQLTLNGPLYVTGNLTIDGAAKVKLNSSYAGSSENIVVDGKVNIAASGAIQGSGTSGSYILITTTSSCGGTTTCTSDSPAVVVNGAAGAVVLIAPYGRVDFQGSASAKSVIAYKMNMSGATSLTYESGLADISFSSGPSGAWSVTSWKEALGL